ncbi:MAG TPA: hypothetical protein VGH56_12955 [Solirubrobacteraceae bacterium]|jgi:hypothetical protein
MAIAYVQEFEVDENDRSTANYDAVRERLQANTNPPAGLIVHTAGFAAGVFRIFDVWESHEQWERFHEERLMPIVSEIMASGSGSPPVREYTYELHDLIRG